VYGRAVKRHTRSEVYSNSVAVEAAFVPEHERHKLIPGGGVAQQAVRAEPLGERVVGGQGPRTRCAEQQEQKQGQEQECKRRAENHRMLGDGGLALVLTPPPMIDEWPQPS
jgi:hypothetical protein